MIRLPSTTRCTTKAQNEAGACGLATDETCKTQITNAGRKAEAIVLHVSRCETQNDGYTWTARSTGRPAVDRQSTEGSRQLGACS
eukprot:4738510-Prymnesium_polylepis.1